MNKEKWTLEKWQNYVAMNSKDSYSLVVILAIIELFEYQIKTAQEGAKVLNWIELHLSGFQAEGAINFVLTHEVEGFPDPEMVKVSKLDEIK